MRKLWMTFLKDAKLSFNGLYFYMEIGMALIFIAVLLFVIPENFESSQRFYVAMELEGTDTDAVQRLMGSSDDVTVLENRSEIESAMKKDRSSVGAVIRKNENKFVYEMILQGYENESMKNLIKAGIEGEVLSQIPGFSSEITVRTLEMNSEKLSDRVNLIPIYLTMNVGMMGLFIIAAYIFLDKEEGVIKAYAVAPVDVWQYLASKMMIMLMMGLITSFVTVLAIVGFSINYLYLLGLIVAFNTFGSALGLLISSFFNTMVKAMGAMYVFIMMMMLPTISYLMPSFNPVWIKVLPSYPMMFSLRELLFENGDQSYIVMQIGIYLLLGLLLFIAANHRFKKTLTV